MNRSGFLLVPILLSITTTPAPGNPPSCMSACWETLEESVAACTGPDEDDCIGAALADFAACALACRRGSKFSVYELPNGRYQLLVRSRVPESREETEGAVPRLKRGRVHVMTVPMLAGVHLRSGLFDDLESLAAHVTAAYKDESRADNADSTASPPFTGPPHILFALPSSGGAFMPVVIVGSNFADPAIPYFNETVSVPLFFWSMRNIPIVGSVSIGFTIAPAAAPAARGSIQIEYQGVRSNLYPFTKN